MNLPRKIEDQWESYLSEEKTGLRASALAKLDALIQSLTKNPTSQWFPWALEVARRVVDCGHDIPVRFPLFREVLFPALLDSLLAGNGSAARFLFGFYHLVYHSPGCLNLLPDQLRSPYGLILEAIRLDGTDTKSKMHLLGILRGSLDYALHELPAGVLFGNNGASIEECDELEKDLSQFVELAAELGRADDYEELFSEAAFHIPAYRDYLRNRGEYIDYSDYLSKHGRR